MDKWNTITKQIKVFLNEHPDAPCEIIISNICFEIWNRQGKKKWDIKVVMRQFLQPEEKDLDVDGIGLEHNKTFHFV